MFILHIFVEWMLNFTTAYRKLFWKIRTVYCEQHKVAQLAEAQRYKS
jgi:hypothetical protein